MILNIKTRKIWSILSGCFLLIGLLNLIDREFLSGSLYIILGVVDIFLNRSEYKKDTASNKTKVSDTDLKSMDTEL